MTDYIISAIILGALGGLMTVAALAVLWAASTVDRRFGRDFGE